MAVQQATVTMIQNMMLPCTGPPSGLSPISKRDGEGIWNPLVTCNLKKDKKDFAWYLSTISWFLVEINRLVIFFGSNIPSVARPQWARSRFLAKLCPWTRFRKCFFPKNTKYQIDFAYNSKFHFFPILFVALFCWVQQGIMNKKAHFRTPKKCIYF